MIALRSKNIIENIDSLSGADGHARATLTRFDLLSYTYEIIYGQEVETIDEDGNPLTAVNQIARVSGRFAKEQINALFHGAGVSIEPGDDFDNKIKGIMTFALLYQMEQDGRFGLTASDWEVAQ